MYRVRIGIALAAAMIAALLSAAVAGEYRPPLDDGVSRDPPYFDFSPERFDPLGSVNDGIYRPHQGMQGSLNRMAELLAGERSPCRRARLLVWTRDVYLSIARMDGDLGNYADFFRAYAAAVEAGARARAEKALCSATDDRRKEDHDFDSL